MQYFTHKLKWIDVVYTQIHRQDFWATSCQNTRNLANSNSHDRPSCRPRCGSTAAAWRMANNCAGMLPRALVFQAQWFSSKVLQLKKYKTCLRHSKMISSNPLRMFWGVSRLAPSQHLTLARVRTRTETLAWSKKRHKLRLEIIQSIQKTFEQWVPETSWKPGHQRIPGLKSKKQLHATGLHLANERIFYRLLKALNNFTDPEKENITPNIRASSNPKTNTVSWRMDVHTCLTYYVESHLITSLHSWFILIRDVPSVSSVALDPPRPCSPSSGQRFSAT